MAMEPQYTLRDTHNRNITALGYSPVRRELMVGFEDGFIRTWEADTGKPVAQYWEHSGWVTDFAYWTATKYMLSSANDGIILVWSIGGGVADTIVIGMPVYCMALNPRRQQLICGVNGGLQIFALDSEKSCGHVINNKLVYWAKEHTDIVRCIVCHESRAYSAGYDQKLIIYDTSYTGEKRMSPVIITPTAHDAGIICLLLVKDNENNMWVVTSSFDKSVRIWSMDGKLVHRLDGFSSTVTGICYVPRNKVVWAAGGTSYATLYDSRSGENISDFIPMFDDQDQNEEKYSLQILKCFHEFNQVVASTSRRHLMTWKYNPQGCVTTLKGNSPLESLTYTSKVPLLIFSGNTEGTITKWERMQSNHFMYSKEFFLLTDTKHAKKTFKKKIKAKLSRHFDKKDSIFEDTTFKLSARLRTPRPSYAPSPALVSSDIKQHEHPNLTTLRMLFVEELDLLIAACEDGNIYIWGFDTAAVTVLQNMEPPDSDKRLINKYAVLLSNSSELLRETTINDNDSVSNRVAGFICKNIFEEHDSCVTSLAVIGHDQGYNSTFLLSGGWDRRIALWDLESGDLVDTLKNAHLSPRDDRMELACDGIITDLAYSPDREEFAYSSSDHMVYIRKFSKRGEEMVLLNTLQGHFMEVTCVVWNHVKLKWITGSEDNTIRIWSGSGLNECEQTLSAAGAVTALCIDVINGAIVAGVQNNIRVFEPDLYTLVQSNIGHTDSVRAIVHIVDRNQYASASSDKTVRIWNSWRVAPKRKKLSKMKGASGLNMLEMERTDNRNRSIQPTDVTEELESEDEEDNEDVE
ncbi:hypothetical protein NP493_146g02006 [Ridgeia piscesae]|uniref:Uncharacterized protein n=1 Tax=Ridgeia piscesae TaxID=27915 RepID=A0AAD9P4U5_RIDPI|nr:hypothetical protein NP493_146g02006 [Ridgeia piscesae]